jgi:predicted acylesterase/phospholipase RssA
MTFEEAFEYTGRIINVTVSPADQHQQGRILNYLTSPNVLIRSASLASCAVPGVFPPVELQAKDVNGRVVPYMPGRRWLDGSVESDLPMLRLSRMHNVNHYIVSQTNPHVVPFLSKQDRRQDRGMLPFAKDMVTSTSRNTLKLARRHMGPNVVSNLIGKMHSITDQKYSGDINVFPQNQTRKLLMVLANPTPKDIGDFIVEGERATWPKLERIHNATYISRTFDSCLLRLKERTYGVDKPQQASGTGKVVEFLRRRQQT